MNALRLGTVICSCISLLLVIIALASDYWINIGTAHFGLWKRCANGQCETYGENAPGAVHAVRAFMLIGMFVGVFALFGLGCTFSRSQIGSYPLTKVVAIVHFCAGICVMIAMATFRGTFGGPLGYYGWSFYFGWVSFVLFILTGSLAFRQQPETA